MSKIYVPLRILIGLVFMVSGFEKLIGPNQNFLYVVQSYALFNAPLEEIAARVLPWVEFFLGVFLVLGFWLKWTLRGVMVLILSFICVVAQALIRKLPIDECGCFGDFISFPLSRIILLDSLLLCLTGLLIYKGTSTRRLSLDRYFDG